MKKISVITPCYNVEQYIKTFLDCIINQTIGVNNIELILIDDASTDHTPDIIKTYEQKYPDMIIAIFNKENLKQGTCRNIALDYYASGEYFCFIDIDDIVPPYYLEYLNESCTCKFILKSYYDQYHFHFAEGVAYEEPLFTHPIKHTAHIICKINEPLYYYRQNPNGTMLSYMQNYDTIYQHMLVQLETFNYVKNNFNTNDYQYEMELYFLHSFCMKQSYSLI